MTVDETLAVIRTDDSLSSADPFSYPVVPRLSVREATAVLKILEALGKGERHSLPLALLYVHVAISKALDDIRPLQTVPVMDEAYPFAPDE